MEYYREADHPDWKSPKKTKTPWKPPKKPPWWEKMFWDFFAIVFQIFLMFIPFLLLKAMHRMSKVTCMHVMVNRMIWFSVAAHVLIKIKLAYHILFLPKESGAEIGFVVWGAPLFYMASIAFHGIAAFVIFLVYLARERC